MHKRDVTQANKRVEAAALQQAASSHLRREQSLVQEKEKELKELREKIAILEAEVTRSTIATRDNTMCSVTFSKWRNKG